MKRQRQLSDVEFTLRTPLAVEVENEHSTDETADILVPLVGRVVIEGRSGSTVLRMTRSHATELYNALKASKQRWAPTGYAAKEDPSLRTDESEEVATTVAVHHLVSDLFDIGVTKRTRIMAALDLMDPSDDGPEAEVLRLQLARARESGKLSELRAMIDRTGESSEAAERREDVLRRLDNFLASWFGGPGERDDTTRFLSAFAKDGFSVHDEDGWSVMREPESSE